MRVEPATEGRQLLSMSISLLQRFVPQDTPEAGSREVIRALMLGALSAGQAIALLVDNGYWREPMVLSRAVLEMMLSACLIQHEPDLHTLFRQHAERTRDAIKQAWDATASPKNLSGAWYWLCSPDKMVKRLAQHEPGITAFRRWSWQLGCSFTHGDALSLSEERRPGTYGDSACWFAGCCLHHMAGHADDFWHEGKHSAEIEAALRQVGDRGA